jgi:hypothetical protein
VPIVFATLILACQPTEDGGAKGGDAGGALLRALSASVAEAECARRARCELPDERFVDEERCQADVADDLVSILAPALEREAIEIDPDALEACEAALLAAGCEMDLERLNALCPDAVRGTVSSGRSCEISAECAGDSVCAEDLDDVCDTECRPRAETVECLYDVECPMGHACLGDPGACVAMEDEGDACGDGELPECGAGLVCVGADIVEGTPGVCAPVSTLLTEAEGERCDPEALVLCAPGLVCAIDSCDGLGCVHRCQRAPAAGEPCTLGFVPAEPCPAGFFCRTAEIDFDDETAEVDDLASMRGVCIELPGLGEDCAETECARGLRCVLTEDGLDERCAEPLELGAPCTDDDACSSWVCAAGACAEPSCEEVEL